MGMQEWLPRGKGRLEKCSRDLRRADYLILDSGATAERNQRRSV
jgi:hypothetical protein